jgi:hypothetical protein
LTRLALLALLVAGCAAAPPATPGVPTGTPATLPTASTPASATPPSFTPTPGATGAAELPSPGARVEPGLYTKASFAPALSFRVGPGWTAEQAYPGFFDIEDDPGSPDVITVQFGNVTGALNAAAVVAAIAADTRLLATDPVNVRIGGQNGVQVVVDTTDPADSSPPIFRPVLTVAPGPLSIASGRRLQITLVDVDNGILAVLVGGSIRKWDSTLQLAEPVIDSLVIAGQQSGS